MDKPEIGWRKEILQDRTEEPSDSNKERQTNRQLSSDSESSSSSTSSTSSNSTLSESSYEKRKKTKQERKEKRKKDKLLKKEKKKFEKAQKREIKRARKEKRKEEKRLKKIAKRMKNKNDEEADCSIPIDLMYTKANAPETKEEYEARQNKIRREVDPVTGRTRLIKGDGEILEEIVSKEQHKEINKRATQGDGEFFQSKTVGWKLP